MQAKYSLHFIISFLFHMALLVIMIVTFEFAGKTYVVENSNKNTEFLNAVMVSASAPPPPVQEVATKPPPVIPVEKPQPQPQKDVIAIKQKKLKQEKIRKLLLTELKKHALEQKKLQQKKIAKNFAKEMKRLAQQSLQKQLLQENQRVAGVRSQQMQGIVDKYKALILQSISQHWLIPGHVDKTLSCELMIRLAPGGSVLDVQLVKSSGDVALDRSARAAVYKASPLPVPEAADEFEPFRHFMLKVRPENALATENWVE